MLPLSRGNNKKRQGRFFANKSFDVPGCVLMTESLA